MTATTAQNTMEGETYSGGTLSIRRLITCGLILMAVTFGAELLNTISWSHGDISIMWPSTGLLIGMILSVPRRQWPAYIAVGTAIDLAANLLPPQNAELSLALCASACNVIEITVAALLLRSSLAPEKYLARAGQLVSLLVYGVIVAPAVASTCYAALLSLIHFKPFWQVLPEWFTADALGISIMTPLYLALRERAPFSRSKWYEVVGLFALLCGVSIAVFWQTSLPLLFAILPVLLLVEFRLGMAGAALGLLAVSSIGGYFTARNHGPISLTVFSLSPRTLMLQIFAFVSMLLLYIAEVVRAARNRLDLGLRASEQRFRLLAEGTTDIITMRDLGRGLEYVSPAVETLLGWKPPEIGSELPAAVHPDDVSSLVKLYDDCLAGRKRNVLELRLLRKDRAWLWTEANLALHRHPETGEPAGFINVIRDISGRKAAEEELSKALNVAENRAVTDPLTGIANRRRLDEYIGMEWDRAIRGRAMLSVLMIDVDHFKHYNDNYGHLAGDRCLREVTGAIASVAHRPADFVGRYGGEEFVVVLPETDTAGARHIAEKIRRAVEHEQIPHQGNPHRVVTVSVGCSTIRPTPDKHSAHLLEGADAAMYLAKQAGRNSVWVDGDEAKPLWP
jgi:diguanylate cyclase (GGDEF)-like protein/PAS domain S-box-containing protein